MTAYRSITVEDWGGTWARPPEKEHPHDPEVFIHHTAGNPMSNLTAEDACQALNDYAKDVKGYSFLDYDYLVHWEAARDLFTICEGRGEWMSAATKDRNELGEAICLFGYFHPGSVHSAQPRPGHIEATARGIVEMIHRGLAASNATILGHYQNPAHPGATGCPGEWMIPHIPTVRARVAELLEEEPMSHAVIRIDGFADQFELLPIGNAEQRRKTGIPESQVPVVARVDVAALEAQLPYRLTPL